MLSLGLVGLPNAGKSTLFNALTRQNVLVADYPFATIDPATGIVPITDNRLNQLARTLNQPASSGGDGNFCRHRRPSQGGQPG